MNTWIVWFALAGLTALGIFFSAAWIFARLWARPRRSLSRRSLSEAGLPGEDLTFESQGKSLSAWFVPAPARHDTPPAVVLVHGWSSQSGQMLPLATSLHDAGLAVLGFDARGHGRSPADGPITLAKFVQDIQAALDYLESRPDIDTGRLGVVGHSFGAASAILAAARDRRIGAVVSLSAFSDPVEVTRRTLRALHLPRGPFLKQVIRVLTGWMGGDPSAIVPIEQISRIRVPILLAHGNADRRVPAGELARLVRAAGPSKVRTLRVHGAGHRSLLRAPEVSRTLTEFFVQAFDLADSSQGTLPKVA
jgi:alpha-beta hydrolase superfamily lysophospholipase